NLKDNYSNIIKRLNIKKMDFLNKDFDCKFCDCIAKEKTPKENHNKVIKELSNAYLYNDKLITPAKVVVGENAEE
ncbi:MAG: nucleotide exchange factor GrpE, partial [archaeon]